MIPEKPTKEEAKQLIQMLDSRFIRYDSSTGMARYAVYWHDQSPEAGTMVDVQGPRGYILIARMDDSA